MILDSLMDFSCRRFARHVAVEVEPLGGGLYRRFQFWIHWVICPFCRRYWDELKAIGRFQRVNSALASHPAAKLPEIKQRFKDKLVKKSS